MKNEKKTNGRTIKAAVSLSIAAMVLTTPALAAGSFASSQLGLGLIAMVNDITPWLVTFSILVAGGFAIYFNIRKGMCEDEQEQLMWKKRIKSALFGGVFGVLATGILDLILSYFQ